MRAPLHIKHFTSCNEGIKLKHKYMLWKNMIISLWRMGKLGNRSFKGHLTRNYAVGLLKTDTYEKYFYSTCQIKKKNAYLNFKSVVNPIRNKTWDDMVNDLYFENPKFYNYIKVDRSRGIRTKSATCRYHDSESVILENISQHMFKNKLYNCQIYIYSQKEPCLNCETIFHQFIERHSLSELTILYHQTNYEQLPSKYNWRYK